MPETIDPNRPWYSIQAAAESKKKRKATVCIYDAIGGWFGLQTSQFVKELNDLDVDEIELHLNSPGGQAFDGIAIYNALRQHAARVTVIVDGLAASAASVIALGGDELIMCQGSSMMIHDASAIAWGNAATCRKTADVLDKLSNNYAKIYARKAGGTAQEWRDAMLAETWYDADEAVEAGLADRTDDTEADAEAMAAFDLSMFVYAGRENAPSPKEKRDPQPPAALGVGFPPPGLPETGISRATNWAAHLVSTAAANTVASVAVTVAPEAPVSSEPGEHNRKEGTPMEEFLTALRTRLGMNAEATAEDILAALDSRAQASTQPPDGTVLVEQGVFDALQSDAAAGREAREQQIKERRDGIIATAKREGRISAASADSFRAQLDKDEDGTVAILATLAPNTAVPVEEKGTSAGGSEASVDAEYDRYFPEDKEN